MSDVAQRTSSMLKSNIESTKDNEYSHLFDEISDSEILAALKGNELDDNILACNSSTANLNSFYGSKKRKREDGSLCAPVLRTLTTSNKYTAATCVLEKVVSGGQTGVDQIALGAAMKNSFFTGGWAPPGFVTESGRNNKLRDVYKLVEIPLQYQQNRASIARAYVQRSMRNVDDSDATLVIRFHSSQGTDKTIGYARNKMWKSAIEKDGNISKSTSSRYKPLFVVTQIGNDADIIRKADELFEFLCRHRVKVLNVAGHRASKLNLDSSKVHRLLMSTFALCKKFKA